MGMMPLKRSCSGYYANTSESRSGKQTREYISVNPDPTNFRITKIIQMRNTYVEAYYPNCTTFEGIKVMVFRGKVASLIEAAGKLDPHFDNTGQMAPIARFEPTAAGRKLAMIIADTEI